MKINIKKILSSPWFLSFVIILIVYYFLFSQIPWNLILKNTTLSGGDTGTHNYIVYHLKSIFPSVKAWSNDWYGGFPFLYFYPPLMFVIAVLMSFVMKLNVAFKITTLLGTLILPICVYLGLKLMGFKKPTPEISLIASISYLFLEVFSIYGGNLPSTLAGEFSYSFSFALFFLFMGLLYKGMDEDKYIALNVVVLSLMVISHPFPVIGTVLYAFFLLFIKKDIKKRFWYVFKVFGLAFCLTAFWAVPFLYYKSYTSMMNWYRTIELKEIFPKTLALFYISSILGIFFAIKNKQKAAIGVLIIAMTNTVLFLVINNSPIYNTRFLPFMIMSYLIIGSYGISELFNILFEDKKILNVFLIVFIVFYLCTLNPRFLFKNTALMPRFEYIPNWFKWNYSGFEDKEPFNEEAEPLFKYVRNLPYGKVMWEYRGEYDKYGTPRFLENIPIWTNKPTFEGLLIESSVFGPFHFINQAETTKEPTSAIAGFTYPSFDFDRGIKHLQMSDARYFICYTDELKKLSNEKLTHLKDIGSFSVYELPKTETVETVNSFKTVEKKKDWIKESIEWYKGNELDTPIVFYTNKKQLNDLTNVNFNKTTNDIRIIKRTDQELTFETNNIGKLHIIKISYFPNWKVRGAKGPYLISPSFLAVIPTQKTVTLSFKNGAIDNLAYFMSYFALFLLVIKIIRPKLIKFI